jgi:hypothetical protein
MITKQTIAPFAAAVYKADTGDRMALLKFVEKQKALHIRVGGVLQEALFDAEGAITGLNAVDVATNRRIPITRPVPGKQVIVFEFEERVARVCDTGQGLSGYAFAIEFLQ